MIATANGGEDAGKRKGRKPEPQIEPLSPLLVDRSQAAALLNICKRTLGVLTATGKLECVRIGRKVQFRRTDLERYVSSLSDR